MRRFLHRATAIECGVQTEQSKRRLSQHIILVYLLIFFKFKGWQLSHLKHSVTLGVAGHLH